MTHGDQRTLLSRFIDEFDRRGWRDVDSTALRIVRAFDQGRQPLDPSDLARHASRPFLAVNRATRAEVAASIARAFEGFSLRPSRPPLIPVDQITSFARAAETTPQSVVSLVRSGLPLPERTVKDLIASIIGEPYLDTDWGGELSDIYTARVILDGEQVEAAFLLKGSGFPNKLRPRNLGRNADQIRRLSKQDARLYVLQHVGQVDEAVRDQLRDMVLARRAEGASEAVGSIWDGADCARLFIAHGLIDPVTGRRTTTPG